MKKTIVVTGASGFIGANIVRLLLAKNYGIHAVVRKGSNLWRLKSVLKKINIHEGILTDINSLKKLLKNVKPQSIFHLATYGSYPFQKDTKRIIETNIKGTFCLLECLKEFDYRSLVVAGSSSEYGKKEKPMAESDILEPNNLYAVAKAAQTHLVRMFAKNNKKNAVILRLFNVYGPFEEKSRLVRSVIESVLGRYPIKLSKGSEARDFIYVKDVADSFLHASSKDYSGEIFNIGTGIQTTIKELAETVIKISKINVPIQLGAYEGRPWDSKIWRADTKKTLKYLQWQPKYTLAEGLKETLAWYEKK